jgi:hypothetical protein
MNNRLSGAWLVLMGVVILWTTLLYTLATALGWVVGVAVIGASLMAIGVWLDQSENSQHHGH